MLTRALMLNPRRKPTTALPPVGNYWYGSPPSSGYLMKVSWYDALGRLDFEPGTSPFTPQSRPGVSNAGYVGVHSDTFPRRLNVHQIASTGLVSPPAASYLMSSLPQDWSVVSVLANGEVLQQKAGSASVYRVTNLVTGAIGPQVSGAQGFINYGDGFALIITYDSGSGAYGLIGAEDQRYPGAGRGRFVIVNDGQTDEATATPLIGISSAGTWSIPFTGLPFNGTPFQSVSTRVRVGTIVVSGGFARSGAMLAGVSGTCSEAYVGSPGFDGRTPVSTTDTRFNGYLRVSANGAVLVPTSVTASYAHVIAVGYNAWTFAWSDNSDWIRLKYSNLGDYPDPYTLSGIFGTAVTDRYLDPVSGTTARLRLKRNGAIVFESNTNNSGGNRFTSIPHLGALLAWSPNANPGVARISFDGGATWRQIQVRASSTVGGTPGPSTPFDMNAAVPLFPYSG